jgi:serine/threonine protein kinase
MLYAIISLYALSFLCKRFRRSMSATKTTAGRDQLDTRKCPNCQAILPPQAQFCGTCGKRVSQRTKNPASSPADNDIHDINERYRITSLIRRRPYVQLLMATDIRYRRPVIIRDIDISSLNKQAQAVAQQEIEEEYNQLRRQRIQDLMLLVDLHIMQDHIYTVAEWPFTSLQREKRARPLYTLDDLLQSGIGLPDETKAVLWISRLTQAVARLHSHHIIIGELDPYAIIVSNDTYEGIPALMVSWLPQVLHRLLPSPPAKAYTGSFYAPEMRKGHIGEQADIYSLGAILYLLLTGTAPTIKTRAKKPVLCSPRELRSTVSSGIDTAVIQALAADPLDRIESAQEFAEILGDLITAPRETQQPTRPLIGSVFKGKRDTSELSALQPFKPTSPYSTKVLPAVPPTLPQTPPPISAAEPTAPLAEQRINTTNQAAQPAFPAIPQDATRSITPVDQNEYSLAIEDIETIIINASEFEAALAQATHHQSTPEDDELDARIASELPEAEQADEEMHNDQNTVSSAGISEMQQAGPDITAQESSSTQGQKQQNSPAADCATIDIKIIEEQTTMTLEEERQINVKTEGTGKQETSIADIPTVSFKGPDPTVIAAASKQQEKAKAHPEEVDKQARQAQPTSSDEHESAGQAESVSSIVEAETQETSIESISTKILGEPIKLSIPAELLEDETEGEQTSVSATHETENEQGSVNQSSVAEYEQDRGADEERPLGGQIKRFFTGPLPIIPRLLANRAASDNAAPAEQTTASTATARAEKLLKRLRHFVLGQQQHNTSAAALIETPLRIQPDQNYTMRIQIMGRDTPRQKGVGLSGLAQDEYVHIEVRSALYHKYAYIVQQADIRLPGNGFAAAVTIPMKPLSDGPSGRRERLHVYFMDEQRNPLYEKPFAIEIFISPLVQPGREGHNVLPIPL